jgi:hypothetical protein
MEEFGEHVQHMHEDRDNLFELEYNVRQHYFNCLIVMRYLFPHQAIERSPQSDYTVAQIPENRARNRFRNIFPCK